MLNIEKIEDFKPGDVEDVLKALKKDGEGAFQVAQELSDTWWTLALKGVHNPSAKEDLRDLILDLLTKPALPEVIEQVVGDRASDWWCNYMTGAFNPTQDINSKDALAMMLVTAAKKAASL